MGDWPEGVSDGLTLPCGFCGSTPRFDYRVSDEAWERLVGDTPHRLGVVCLPCLDGLAAIVGMRIGEHIEQVQFVGIGHTTVLVPERVVVWPGQ